MNVCIVTVYNSENCGSFLQAYALYTEIKKLGHNVYFLERDVSSSSHALTPHLIDIAKKIAKLDFCSAKMIWKKYLAFNNAQTVLPTIKKNSSEYNNIDCFVIGSDTVWNLNNNYFHNNINTYFGLEFRGKKFITYGVSAANTGKEKFLNNEKIKKAVEKIADISVRDTHTYEIVSDISGIKSELVCDPTFLLDKEDYNSVIQNEITVADKPLLIYYFGKLPEETVKRIKELRSKTGKKIVSLGEYREWCDINLTFDPYLFIQCFRDCSFVLTNTYHGSIFSLIYQKPFADFGKDKKKIEYLLSSLKAETAFAQFNEDLMPFYEQELDYDKINKEIIKLRNSSEEFLKRNLV